MKALDLLLTPNMVVSVSGRRRGGTAYEEHCADQLGLWIDRIRPDVVMSGMALGIDTVVADIAMDRGRALHAVIPGEWQPNRWNQAQRLHWRELISYANRKLTVIEKGDLPGGQRSQGFVIDAFHRRNRWMATHSTLTIVCWDGIASGGTYHMLRECRVAHQPVLLVRPGHNTRLLCDTDALVRAITPVRVEVPEREMAVA